MTRGMGDSEAQTLIETLDHTGAEVIDFSDIGRGHNSDAPRREYLDLRKSVWESNASTAEKLVALAIIEHMQPGKLNAYPSQSRLLKMCSVSPRTFRRAFAMVRAWFDVEVRPGRATIYSVKVVKTSKEIASLLDRIRGCQNDTIAEGAKMTPGRVPKRHPTPCQNGTLPPANLAPQKRPVRDQEEKKDSVPSGTGAEAPPPEKSLREMIWDEGIAWLRPRACLDEARLRQRVGRWVSEHDPGTVLNAIAVAQKENPVSVMAYIEGVLRRGPTITVNGKRLAPWEAEALERERREDAALDELRKYEKTLNREGV